MDHGWAADGLAFVSTSPGKRRARETERTPEGGRSDGRGRNHDWEEWILASLHAFSLRPPTQECREEGCNGALPGSRIHPCLRCKNSNWVALLTAAAHPHSQRGNSSDQNTRGTQEEPGTLGWAEQFCNSNKREKEIGEDAGDLSNFRFCRCQLREKKNSLLAFVLISASASLSSSALSRHPPELLVSETKDGTSLVPALLTLISPLLVAASPRRWRAWP